MKTMYFRLLATIITLAAVTTANQSVNAQRRNTATSETRSREVSTNERADKIERKGTSRNEAIEKSATTREVKQSNVERYSDRNTSQSANSNTGRTQSELKRGSTNTEQTKSAVDNQVRNSNIENNNRNTANNKSVSTRNEVVTPKTDNNNDRRATSNSGVRKGNARSTVTNTGSVSNRNSNHENTKYTSEKYYHNSSDSRYKPNENYRGSRQNWSSDIRSQTTYHNNSNVNVHVNYWDRRWENYCWNQNSWVNYYGYYNPYAYRNYKYYYHHKYYGDVIRRFEVQPLVLMYAGLPYYYFEGNFFRYQKRVGYVLVDMAFGTTFDYLPDGYERVFINGFPYYRFGNLFFENTLAGFQLVHYPERYYTFDPHYNHRGFSLSVSRF